jgi:hypothetical protein
VRKVHIYLGVNAPSQQAVVDAIRNGAAAAGLHPDVFGEADPQHRNADAVVVFGISGKNRQVWDANAWKRRILLDKPYIRGLKSDRDLPRYSRLRVSLDSLQPVRYFQGIPRKPDRWEELKVKLEPYRKRGQGPILLDGGSNKFLQWRNLGDPTKPDMERWAAWGQSLVDRIRQHSQREIIYRARPSHNPNPILERCVNSALSLKEDFSRCALVVSHGGNLGVEAVVSGIPHFATSPESMASPLSETRWELLDRQFYPSDEARTQWARDLAYCQWTMAEFENGRAWRYILECDEWLGAGPVPGMR